MAFATAGAVQVAQADAASVRVDCSNYKCNAVGVDAQDGARNSLVVDVVEPYVWAIRETRDEAPPLDVDGMLRGEEICAPLSPREWRCEVPAQETTPFSDRTPLIVQGYLGPDDRLDTGPAGCDGDGRMQISDLIISASRPEADGPGSGRLVGTPHGDTGIESEGKVKVLGCDGSDKIYGTNQSQLVGGGGKDDLYGDQNAIVTAGSGRDSIELGPKSVGQGGTGSDSLVDFRGSSRLFGGPGSDVLGDWSCAPLDGLGRGRDVLDGGPGADRITAGCNQKGSLDSLDVELVPTDPDRIICGTATDRATAGKNSRLKGCEKVIRLPRTVRYARNPTRFLAEDN